MANVQLNHIYKVYENGTKAVSDFNMSIEDKEFIVFVGPSGCGKSTTLRMIAGLEEITAGDLFIDNRLVNDLEPKDRDVTMVFQNYALYPHMTVYDNMAFGLKIAHLPKEEIDKRVHEAAKILDIEEYLEKKPREMSGGQRQRVALGRAIVRHPKVFLLDEPLSNLDAKLRATMRTEISKLHKKLQTTFIYVTHDQIEAMTMGTRIVVMKKGFVQQIDTPKNLYNYPINQFVASFIGTPQMNFFEGHLRKEGERLTLTLENQTIGIPASVVEKMDKEYFDGRAVTIGIRPEDIHYTEEGKENSLAVIPQVIEELGSETIVNSNLSGSESQLTFKAKESDSLETGKEIHVLLTPEKLHFFDKESGVTLLPRIPLKREFTLKRLADGKGAILSKEIVLPPCFLERTEEGKEYTLSIPTDAVTEGNTFEGTITQVEAINGKYLFHIQVGSRLLFALSKKQAEKGTSLSFDLDFTEVTLLEAGSVLLPAVVKENHLLGKLHRIKAEVPYEKKGKIRTKKKTGFQFALSSLLVDVPPEMYEKVLSVLVKKFELHDIDYTFLPEAGTFRDTGIALTLKEVLNYGEEGKYGVFESEKGEKILLALREKDMELGKTYYLSLCYDELNAKDTHFDIKLK